MTEIFNWKKFRYFSKDPQTLLTEVKEQPHRGVIPIDVLYGTQALTEYSNKKRRQVEINYHNHGKALLEQFPIITTAIPCADCNDLDLFTSIFPDVKYSVVLLDGHHRVRYGPLFGIRHFPAIILSPLQTTIVYGKTDVFETIGIINDWVNNSLRSFSQKNSSLSIPNFVSFKKEGLNLSLV